MFQGILQDPVKSVSNLDSTLEMTIIKMDFLCSSMETLHLGS